MMKLRDASTKGDKVSTSFCEVNVNCIDPVTPVRLTALAVKVLDPAKVGVPDKSATPLMELSDKSDRRSGDERLTMVDAPPKKLTALNGMGAIGRFTNALEKTALFEGVVKTTVSV
jgi:hypothetical protein